MKNLFSALVFTLLVVTTFNSCEKEDPLVADLQCSGVLKVGERIGFVNEQFYSAEHYWDFGDGTTETHLYSGTQFYHTYTTAGTYRASLTIKRGKESVYDSKLIVIAP